MPEDATTSEEQEAHAPGIVHDDIMHRLLEYQRQLREGVSPGKAAKAVAAERPMIDAAEALAATETETTEVVDLTEAEAELEAAETAEAESNVEEEQIEPIEEPVAVVAEESAETSERPMAERLWGESTDTTQPVPSTDLTARVAELEDALARVSTLIGELRERFQDMAIASDERLAAIEEALSGTGGADRN